jgi:hypothetical protein
MEIYILKDIEGIKNPLEGYFDVTENIRMAKSQGFERCKQAILSQAIKIDTNELADYMAASLLTLRGAVKKFLQSKLEESNDKKH